MKKLYTFGLHQRALAGLLKELLEQEGVACLLRNEQLFIGLGEIPFVELFPELWVVDEEVYPRARLLLNNWLREQGATADAWTCPDCGEVLEGQFGACWQCGRVKSDDEDSARRG